jgi:hydrogenase nickel incorporation protein HypA/HybF
MHELTVTKNIFQIVHKHAQRSRVQRVVAVNLEIGALSDLHAVWLQRYFDHLSRGTEVEGAKLNINRIPAVFRCRSCGQLFEINSLLEEDLLCSHCQSKAITLVSGREYRVKSMEAV